jgi:hypothetical protein
LVIPLEDVTNFHWTLQQILIFALTSSLSVPVYRSGLDYPQDFLLSLSYLSIAGSLSKQMILFSSLLGGLFIFPTENPNGTWLSSLADFFFFKVFRSSLFLRFHRPSGFASAVAFLDLIEEPLSNASSHLPLRIWFVRLLLHLQL